MNGDSVNHPDHYGGDTTYEVIKVLEAWRLGFKLGNAVKYIARAGKKDPAKEIEDLKKARFYLDHRITELECIEDTKVQLKGAIARARGELGQDPVG